MPGSELVQSVQRAVKLLQIVSTRPEGISLQELAAESGLQKSTAGWNSPSSPKVWNSPLMNPGALSDRD